MGLDDGPGDADESGAPHLVGVQLGLECAAAAGMTMAAASLVSRFFWNISFRACPAKEPDALHGLEQDVAGEAVGDDDVARRP